MLHTYPSDYVYEAQEHLGIVFDYLFTSCEISINKMNEVLDKSKILKQFSMGNPYYLAGKSGIELAKLIAEEFNIKEEKEYLFPSESTKFFWAGYYLAYYCWYKCKTIDYVFYAISVEKLLKMYPCYHQMGIMNFVDDFDQLVFKGIKETNLKLLRMINNLSQSELAKKSGVSLRSIQLYEQKVNDINKAQAGSLLKLARCLHRNIEDLLEEQ